MRRLRYDEPQRGDEIALVDASGKVNGLFSEVECVLASDFDPDRFEIRDKQGRVLYVERVNTDTWRQFLLRD